MSKKKPVKVIVKEFTKLSQLMDFFPARNLRADYLSFDEKEHLGLHETKEGGQVIGVLQGIGWAIADNEVYKLNKDQMIFVPAGKVCDFYNRNKITLKIVSVVYKNNISSKK